MSNTREHSMQKDSGQQKLLLAMDFSVFGRKFKLKGEFGHETMFIKSMIMSEDITFLLGKMFKSQDAGTILEFLPDTIDFGIRRWQSEDRTKSALEFSIYSESFGIRLIKTANGTLMSVSLKHKIEFSALPIVGEYLSGQGITEVELVYLIGGPMDKVFLDGMRTNYAQGFNLGVGYQIGNESHWSNFPDDKNEQGQPDRLSDGQDKDKANSIVQLTEINPSVDSQGAKISISGVFSLSFFRFEVIGLGINIPFSLFRNFSFPTSLNKLGFALRGLSLRYISSGFSIEGGIYHETNQGEDGYFGLLRFKIGRIQLLAIASYVKTETCSAVFAFGYLGATIPIHPAFQVRGLGLGFALNRSFKMPEISKVPDFPLIKLIDSGGPGAEDPISKQFSVLGVYMPVQKDSYVLMGALRFSSFNMIETVAVLAVSISKGLCFNMLGISVFSRQGMYHVELAFSLRVDFEQGSVMARAELSNRSYLLFPGLRVLGSAAFGMWFKGELAGDFILTIGGYHPDFKIPKHYPQDMSRIGYEVQLGPIRMVGRAYIALTPGCIMAGIEGRLSCEHNSSLISASISLGYQADFLIMWKPFQYYAAVKVDLRVKVCIKMLFIRLKAEFNLSANLEVWGPEFGGRAKFKVLRFEIPVVFGKNRDQSKTLEKAEFIDSYLADSSRILSHRISAGIIRTITRDQKEIIVVNAKELEIEISSQIPISRVTGMVHEDIQKAIYPRYSDSPPIENTLVLKAQSPEKWIYELVNQSVPSAVWGRSNRASSGTLDESLEKDVCMGIRLGFTKVQNPIQPVEVSLYDQIDKTYSDGFIAREFRYMKNSGEIDYSQLVVPVELGIIEVEDFDASDLSNTDQSYRYHYNLGTYSTQ